MGVCWLATIFLIFAVGWACDTADDMDTAGVPMSKRIVAIGIRPLLRLAGRPLSLVVFLTAAC